MGQVEHQQVGVLGHLDNIRLGPQVLGELDTRKIAHVLVVGVDDLGQVAAVDLLLKHPHVHIVLEQVRSGGSVFSKDFGDGGAPVAGADYGDLERQRWQQRLLRQGAGAHDLSNVMQSLSWCGHIVREMGR